MRTILVCSALALLACDPTPPIGPDPIDGAVTGQGGASSSATSEGAGAGTACSDCGSGTRLKAVLHTGDDGSVWKDDAFFYDSTLGVNCYVWETPDLVARCVPVTQAQLFASHFADAACTIPTAAIVKQPPCLNPPMPAYALETVNVECASTRRVYPVTGVVPGDVYANTAGCQLVNPVVLNNFHVYTIGPEIPPSTFVSFTESHE